MAAILSIILFLIVAAVAGIAMIASSFKRVVPAPPAIPPAQTVASGRRRIDPGRPRLRIAIGRLVLGVLLLAIGGGGILFLYGMAELARVASH